MINLEKNIKSKKKYNYFFFDVDGVIFNSKKNMQISWNKVNKHFNLNIPFKKYFKIIGIPFVDILNLLKIPKDKHEEIFKLFQKTSIKNLNKIKIYDGVKKLLKQIKKNKKNKISIVTSKDLNRVKKICKIYDLKFDFISSPQKGLKGKPNPDQILFVMNKLNLKNKNECIFIGDTINDLKAAKSSGIDFAYVKYGYGQWSQIKKNMIGKKNNFFTMNNIYTLSKIVDR